MLACVSTRQQLEHEVELNRQVRHQVGCKYKHSTSVLSLVFVYMKKCTASCYYCKIPLLCRKLRASSALLHQQHSLSAIMRTKHEALTVNESDVERRQAVEMLSVRHVTGTGHTVTGAAGGRGLAGSLE